ncbi:hypothetical protein RKD19_005294 [Streptomyces canus]
MRQVDGQGRLSDPAHAVDRLDGDHVRGSASLAQRGGELPQFITPSGPRDIARQVVRHLARRPRGVPVLGAGAGEEARRGGSRQDSLVDPVQSAAGVEADVVDDALPGSLEESGGLGRPVAAVQGDGESLGQRLVHGVCLGLRHEHGYGVAELPGFQQDFGSGQRGDEAGLADGGPQVLGPGAGDPGQRLAVPQCLRAVQHAQSGLLVPVVPQGTGPLDAVRVTAQVHAFRVDLQGVRVRTADDRGSVAPGHAQGGSDTGDVGVERLPGLGGRMLVPDAVDQGVHAHRAARVPGEAGERQPCLGRSEIATAARRSDLHRSRKPDLELHQRPPRR